MMQWFNNLKIRNKLIIGFIVVAIFSAIVGVMGIINMRQINDNSRSMYYDNYIPAQYLADTEKAVQTVRALNILAIYEQNPSALQEKLDEINLYVSQTNGYLQEIRELISGEEEQGLYDELSGALAEYRKVRDESLEYVSKGQYEQAVLTMPTVNEKTEALNKVMEDYIGFQSGRAERSLHKNESNFKQQTILMFSTISACVAIALFLGFAVARKISVPVARMVKAADQLALGDINVNVQADSKDEIGSLARAFSNMIENIKNQAFAVERIASGDLTMEVEIKSDADLLGKKLYEMVEENNEVLNSIAAASEQVAEGSRQIADSSMALSQGATEQASSVEELTAALEEISSQTRFNAQNADSANELAVEVKEKALAGNKQMIEMLRAMEDINESSSNISKIIKVIDDIAFQTNILALNAAVEAARAGQHGKGFAVVAEEVRNLAARSADAAKETTDLIEGSIKKMDGGTRIAKETADALGNIVSGVEKVASLVDRIATASNEQATGISQINQGISQVSQVIQNNSATSEEGAAASEELTSQAILLKELVSKFKLKKTNRYGQNHISPEVLEMLENMAEKKKNGSIQEQAYGFGLSSPKSRIALNDNEFDKY